MVMAKDGEVAHSFQPLMGQYCGHILGCLLINDAVIAKGFVLWTGFVQTLPIAILWAYSRLPLDQ